MEKQNYDVEAVKERLIDYYETEKDVDSQIERLERLEIRLRSIGSPVLSDMPKGGSPAHDRMADMIAQKVDLENEIRQMVVEQKKERQAIEGILSHLRHSDEKTVIRMKYLDGFSWGEVLDVLFGGKEDFLDKEDAYTRRMYRIHGSALLNMARYIETGAGDTGTE